MEWVLSRKKERNRDIITLLMVPLFLVLVFFYFFGYAFAFVVSGILLALLICGILVIFYKTGKWYPLVIKLYDDTFTMGRLDPKEGFVEIINPIKLDKIYRIVITKHLLTIYHIADNGTKYRTQFPLKGMFIEEIEKRKEILNEILKRIDREKVEIIDKRRK